MRKRLLASFAHPDDEAFAPGGTLAQYAAAGVEVTLVCATRGEAGEIADSSLATPETLPSVREQELRCAAEELGIREVIFLGYRDSGMAGTPENERPDAFVNVPAEEVVPRLVEIMRRVRPQVVLTFDPHGGYGHPDHIAIHRHTVAAFQAAGDPQVYPDRGKPWQPDRLFYAVFPRSFFQTLRETMIALGQPVEDLETFENEAGFPDEEIDVRVDVSAKVLDKWSALECHRTQFGQENLFRRLPREQMLELMSCEHFSLAIPGREQAGQLQGLFDRIG